MPDARHVFPSISLRGQRVAQASLSGRAAELRQAVRSVRSEAELPGTLVCLASVVVSLQSPFPGATQVGGKSGQIGERGKV